MNKKSFKSVFKRTTITLSIIVLSSTTTLFTVKYLAKIEEPTLPSLSQMITSTKYFNAENSYLVYNNLNFSRREVPKNLDSIYVIVSSEFTKEEKNTIKKFLNNVNELFKTANPEYKFQYTEDISTEKLNNISVGIGSYNRSGESEIGGSCGMSISGSKSKEFSIIKTTAIIVDESRRINLKTFQSAFAREFGRALGLNYISEEHGFQNSVMYDKNQYTFFTENDVYLIISLYGKNDYENILGTKQKINNLLTSVNGEYSQEN